MLENDSSWPQQDNSWRKTTRHDGQEVMAGPRRPWTLWWARWPV